MVKTAYSNQHGTWTIATRMVGLHFGTVAVARRSDGYAVEGEMVGYGCDGAAVEAVKRRLGALTDVELTARCRAFAGEGVREHRLSVEPDGTVRVWDSVAGHYTLCHSLSASAERRIRGLVEVAS